LRSIVVAACTALTVERLTVVQSPRDSQPPSTW